VTGVLGGFAALGAVIAVGWVVGCAGILGAGAEVVLSRLSFFVATPALLFLTLADADPGEVLSAALIGTAGSAVLAALAFVVVAWWRRRLPAAGLLFAAGGWELPGLVLEPIKLVAGLAVPAALLAYGMSLHGAPRPASRDQAGQVWLAVALKTVAQPLLAYALGRWVVGLDGVALLAVTVTSALPTAQNVFVYAASYGRSTLVARDVILLSTVLSVPVLVAIALVLS
jgi:predicted permease